MPSTELQAVIVGRRSREGKLTNHSAFSEMVPVLHIVGVPSTTQLKNKPMLHHTLGNGRYVFLLFVDPVTHVRQIRRIY